MPTYEYACTSCKRHVEAVQRFSDAPLQTCDECGGALKRVFHPVGVVLKGSGFYATDSRGGKKAATPPTPKTDTGTTGSVEKKKSSGSDTSTAAS